MSCANALHSTSDSFHVVVSCAASNKCQNEKNPRAESNASRNHWLLFSLNMQISDVQVRSHALELSLGMNFFAQKSFCRQKCCKSDKIQSCFIFLYRSIMLYFSFNIISFWKSVCLVWLQSINFLVYSMNETVWVHCMPVCCILVKNKNWNVTAFTWEHCSQPTLDYPSFASWQK